MKYFIKKIYFIFFIVNFLFVNNSAFSKNTIYQMTNILEQIIKDKKDTLNLIKKNNSLDYLEKKIKNLNFFYDFKQAIQNNKGISLISEIKKASPSAGILVENFNHLDIAKIFIDNGATCLSVLTEEKYFFGKLRHKNSRL